MLDLETLGSGFCPVILSIGAVAFDFETFEEKSTFYQPINIEDSVRAGLHIEPGSVRWWAGRSAEAREAAFYGQHRLVEVLTAFQLWFPDGAPVWGNGSGFDNRILREAYRVTRLSCPWDYHLDYDLRTLLFLSHQEHIEVERTGIAHHALDDAIHQVNVVKHAVSCIRNESAGATPTARTWQEERADVVAYLRQIGSWYSTDIFSEPPPADALSAEEKLVRTRESAAMGRHASRTWSADIDAGLHEGALLADAPEQKDDGDG